MLLLPLQLITRSYSLKLFGILICIYSFSSTLSFAQTGVKNNHNKAKMAFNALNYPIQATYRTKTSSLSFIAKKLRADESYSIYKISQLLFALNPSAFLNNNINKLKSGVNLSIPNLRHYSLKKNSASFNSIVDKQSVPVAKSNNFTKVKAKQVELKETPDIPNLISPLENKNKHEIVNQQNTNDVVDSDESENTKPLTQIYSDQVEKADEYLINFIGHVSISQPEQKIESHKASYHLNKKLFTAIENVKVNRDSLAMQGSTLQYNSKTKKGQFNDANYQLAPQSNFSQSNNKTMLEIQGRATLINFSEDISHFEDGTFSTCPADEEDWAIKSSEITIHSQDSYGEAKHVTFYIKEMPVMYMPYIQFPIGDKRKSGFLFPHFSYVEEHGAEFSIPYYWNIAPNYDATITPRILSRRGLLLSNQFRHLSQYSHSELSLELIEDQRFDMPRTNDNIIRYGNDVNQQRGLVSLKHQHQLAKSWQAHIDYNYVSDNYYLNDFSSKLNVGTTSNLNRELRLSHSQQLYGGQLNFNSRFQTYQLLTVNTNTYSRLPQLELNYHKYFSKTLWQTEMPLEFGFSSEAVNFVKSENFNSTINEGYRYSARPYLELAYENNFSFIKPRLSLDLLQYNLTQTSSVQSSSNQSRVLPILSLDNGLFLERKTNLFGQSYQQTLEPRLYYLYVKHEKQNDFPLFDTGLNQFTFAQLFRDNRFTGVDRLGDANQLSGAVTTRYINSDGLESFRASIGQIWYFNDRKVQTNNSALTNESTTASSKVAVELASEFYNYWNSSLSLLYNPKSIQEKTSDKIEQANARLQYNNNSDKVLNLAYIYQNPSEQFNLSSYWKVSSHWNILGYASYLLDEQYTPEVLVGLEYDSCCYALRLAFMREKTAFEEEANNRILLQISFKGLSSVGNQNAKLLRSKIPGASNNF